MYNNIGEKIKGLATFFFLFGAAVSVIAGLALLSDGSGIWGIVLMIGGAFVSWVSSWLLYAFGELVEDVHAIRNKTNPQGAPEAPTTKHARSSTDFFAKKSVPSIAPNTTGNCDFCLQKSSNLRIYPSKYDEGTMICLCDKCARENGYY